MHLATNKNVAQQNINIHYAQKSNSTLPSKPVYKKLSKVAFMVIFNAYMTIMEIRMGQGWK